MGTTVKVFVPNKTRLADLASFLVTVRAPVTYSTAHSDGVDLSLAVTHGAVPSVGRACTHAGFTFGGKEVTQPAKRKLPKEAPEKESEKEPEVDPEIDDLAAGLAAGVLKTEEKDLPG